jgi:hypothetical protein
MKIRLFLIALVALAMPLHADDENKHPIDQALDAAMEKDS